MTGRSDDAREAMDDRVEAAVKAEQVRWQERLEFLQREYGVDGGGCDSGDPLDFTEDEVRQALASARAAGAAEAFERAAKRVSAHLDCEEAGGRCARGILDVLEQDAAAPVRP